MTTIENLSPVQKLQMLSDLIDQLDSDLLRHVAEICYKKKLLKQQYQNSNVVFILRNTI